MNPPTKRKWDEGSEEARLAMMRWALEQEGGNITRAAKLLGVGYATAKRVVKEFNLSPYAAELRVKAGESPGPLGKAMGRPWKTGNSK